MPHYIPQAEARTDFSNAEREPWTTIVTDSRHSCQLGIVNSLFIKPEARHLKVPEIPG